VESSLSIDRVSAAAQFLNERIRRTPVEFSAALSERMGQPVWLKLECLQLTGSFKIRGAWWRLHQASAEERRAGVATCSAGNHGKGIAYASRQEKIPAAIFVPSGIDEAKYHGMVALGADVRRSAYPGYDDTEAWAREEAARLGMPFISAFDDYDVMAGNGGTLALECLEQAPDASTFLVPVGGGGLSAGFAFVADGKRVIGCQHERSPAFRMSLDQGRAVTTLPVVETVAGGIEGGIGSLTFEVLNSRIREVALLSEEEIIHATRWMAAEHQYWIEPTAAVTLAACLSGKVHVDGPTVIVISGRNVSLETALRILSP
jgi:threonine dehydratase